MGNGQKENKMIDRFQHYFPGNSDEIRVFFAPGRVNLIGDHTDYNGGYVLPAALTIGTYMAVRPRNDKWLHLYSGNFPNDPLSFSVEDISYKVNDPWGNYPKGAVNELLDAGVDITGADIYYHGNIPNGAGLSSSASIGIVTAFALSEIAGVTFSNKQLARISQRMENRFIGVNTGIMDQYAISFGKKNHALFFNCRTLDIEEVPLELGDYQLMVTNTNKRRGLAGSKYNERREQCEKGLKALQKKAPHLETLSELTMNQFRQLKGAIKDPVVLKRVRHVVSENQRVKSAKDLLKQGDLPSFGECMKESHESLRDDYEVTSPELNVLFETQKNVEGCIGTRMTGAGFGGCTVSIVHNGDVIHFQKEVKAIYEKEIGREPSFYRCQIGDGVKKLKKAVVE